MNSSHNKSPFSWLASLTAATLLVSTLAACSSTPSGSAPSGGGNRQQRQMTVSTEKVKLADVGGGQVFSGSITPAFTTNVASRVTGRVSEVMIKIGDRVQTGQPLVRIDTTTLEQTLSQQQASLAVTEAQFQRAVNDQANAQTKAEKDYALQQAQYEKTISDQQNAVAVARQAVAVTQAQLNNAILSQQNAIATAKQAVATAQVNLNKAVNDAANQLNTAQNTLSFQQDNLTTQQTNSLDNLEAAFKQALYAYQGAKEEYEANETSSKKAAMDTALNKLQQAQNALEQAQNAPISNLSSNIKSYIDAQAALVNAQNSQAVQIAQESLNEKLLALANAQAASTETNQQQLQRDQVALNNAQNTMQNVMSVSQAQLAQSEQTMLAAKSTDAVKVSEAQLLQAQTNVRVISEQLKDGVLNAPVSGVVTAISAPVGQNAANNTAVLSIASVDPIYATVNVSEGNIGKVKVGMPMTVSIPTLNKSFEGKVAVIRPVLDSTTKSYGVDIQIDDPKKELLPGMFAVSSLKSEGRQAIMVPADAVVSQPSGNAVFIVKDGKARKIIVKTGTLTSAKIEITSGLKEGDEIVVKNQEMLSDNVAVTVVQPDQENTGGKGQGQGQGQGQQGKQNGQSGQQAGQGQQGQQGGQGGQTPQSGQNPQGQTGGQQGQSGSGNNGANSQAQRAGGQ